MHTRYQATHFLTSVRDLKQLPPADAREVAFAGRSNSGKSSALNALTGRKALARVSKTPGRTQMINYFEVEPGRYLVDLPGYGYARVPEAVRLHWQQLLERYFNERKALCGLILLLDIRRSLTELDRQMLDWCEHRELPSHILLTKADKLKRGPATTALQQVRRELREKYSHADAQLFSAPKRIGVDQACAKLDEWLGYDLNQRELTGG